MILNFEFYNNLWDRAKNYIKYKEFLIFLDYHYRERVSYSFFDGVKEDCVLVTKLENYLKFLKNLSIEVVER